VFLSLNQAYLHGKRLKDEKERAVSVKATNKLQDGAASTTASAESESEERKAFRALYTFRFQCEHPSMRASGHFEFGDFNKSQHKAQFTNLMKRLVQ
jgi:hypothetical protein